MNTKGQVQNMFALERSCNQWSSHEGTRTLFMQEIIRNLFRVREFILQNEGVLPSGKHQQQL